MSKSSYNRVEKIWYGDSPLALLLLPLSWIFALLTVLRRYLYRTGILKVHVLSVPVIVIGNISVGGTGKTPVTIWLAEKLLQEGYSPGIITRGYRGSVGSIPVVATSDSETALVGDEAVLMARRCACPIVVNADRVAAARKAIELGIDIIISDDGLQHYRLGRDFEIAVIDGARGFGNGHLLPAGPLRETEPRLASVEAILVQHETASAEKFLVRSTDPKPRNFELRTSSISRLDDSEVRPLKEFSGKSVHAIAGIGNPERFFRMLESFGIKVMRHPLQDHATITPDDLSFADEAEIVMTEKDAVKCSAFETTRCWYVPAAVEFESGEGRALLRTVLEKITPRLATGG